MSRETEKMLRDVQKYLDQSGPISDQAELEARIRAYMEQQKNGPYASGPVAETPREKAEDLLDEAYESEDEEVALRKAKAALRMDPTFMDAELFMLDFEDDDELKQAKFEKLLAKEKARLDADENTRDDSGHYYGILETRPYVRLAYAYIELLRFLGKYRKAMLFAEGLIDLNKNDNLGVRYILMAIYAQLEDETRAVQLYERFDEDSVQMLLPMMMLYYKLDYMDKAKSRLRRLTKAYPNFYADFAKLMHLETADLDRLFAVDTYSPNTPPEILISLQNCASVVASTRGFLNWLEGQLPSSRPAKASSSSKRVDFNAAKKAPRRKK